MLAAAVKPKVDDEVRERRKQAGLWLLSLREEMGMSQRQLAEATGVAHYPFISQLERGVGRVPAERYGIWAEALGQDQRAFTIRAMSYYDRALYDLLFVGTSAPLADIGLDVAASA